MKTPRVTLSSIFGESTRGDGHGILAGRIAGNGARAVKLGDSKGTFKLCRRGAGSEEKVVL